MIRKLKFMETSIANIRISLSDGSSYILGDCFFSLTGVTPSDNAKISAKFNSKTRVFIFDFEEKMKKLKGIKIEDEQDGCYSEYDSFSFSHANGCPCYEMKKNPEIYSFAPTKIDVRLACCALIFDSSNRLLLTRRHKDLRSFPSCWVTPGGRLDENEDLEACVLREVEEEVGIKIEKKMGKDNKLHLMHDGKECSMDHFFLYESVFPTLLDRGFPKVQNLVMFYYIKLKSDISKIKVKVQESEVDKAIWISQDVLKQIIENKVSEKELELNCYSIGHNGSVTSSAIPKEYLDGVYPNNFNEGIGEGHLKAIRYYLKINDK